MEKIWNNLGATIFCNGEDKSFHKRELRFILVDGKWKYNSGDIID